MNPASCSQPLRHERQAHCRSWFFFGLRLAARAAAQQGVQHYRAKRGGANAA
jgi:hypothetical protein